MDYFAWHDDWAHCSNVLYFLTFSIMKRDFLIITRKLWLWKWQGERARFLERVSSHWLLTCSVSPSSLMTYLPMGLINSKGRVAGYELCMTISTFSIRQSTYFRSPYFLFGSSVELWSMSSEHILSKHGSRLVIPSNKQYWLRIYDLELNLSGSTPTTHNFTCRVLRSRAACWPRMMLLIKTSPHSSQHWRVKADQQTAYLPSRKVH